MLQYGQLSSVQQLQQLIMQGEGQHLDFKFNISSSKKIAKSLVAFANTGGGRLLIGVKDNGKIAGVRSDEEIYMIEAASQMYCKPIVPYQVREWEVDEKTVVEIFVPPGNDKPYLALSDDDKWLAYIRYKDQNILANLIWLKIEERKKKGTKTLVKYGKAEQQLLNYLQEHGKITFSEFRKLAGISPKLAEKILVNLAAIGVVQQHITPGLNYFSQS